VVQRKARLPVPPRPHQRCPAGTRTVGEHLRPRGPDPAPPGRDRHLARRPCRYPFLREPQPSPGDRSGRGGRAHRPAARRRRRPHLRPGQPDPERRRSRCAVRHYWQRPL